MYNQGQYNTFQYNGSTGVASASGQDDIVFNSYSLQSATVITRDLIESMPQRDFQTDNVPRGDGAYVIGDFFRGKRIDIRGLIKKATAAELEAEMDTMRKELSALEGNLDILFDGELRRFKATLTNGDQLFSGRQHYHVTTMPFEASFLCSDPFGKSTEYVSTAWMAESLLSFDEQVNHGGTTRTKPVIIINFSAASAVTGLTFTNNTRAEEISIAETIIAGDYVKIDCETMAVTINSVEVDYSGSFPLFDPGATSFTLDIDGTSATYDLTVKFKTSYL